jgi:hypothetical protein
MPFFATISRNLKYRTIEWIEKRTLDHYQTACSNAVNEYVKAGFIVTTMLVDQEFKGLSDYMFAKHKVIVNVSSAQDHVSEAERNNRTIKERIRACFHDLPFKSIPKLMIKYMVYEMTRRLNFFPAKGGVSKYYSPREILHHVKLDYDKHLMIPMFSFVQAHDEQEPRNSQVQRTIDCIYLRPMSNIQGGHELYNISTRRVISRRKVTIIPMTDRIVKLIESLAVKDGMKGLKLVAKDGCVVTTGVNVESTGVNDVINDDDSTTV